MTQIPENIAALETAILKSCKKAGRARSDVRLIAVSKKQPIERIKAALDSGQRIFGENRVQEAFEHWIELKEQYEGIELHLIGPLQTNKVRDAIRLFDIIHTVDRLKLAVSLADEMKKQNRFPACFIQVNTGEEDQKHGVSPEGLPELLDYCRNDCGLDVKGLMCIPPFDEPPSMHFALLAKLAQRHDLPELSMGMSGDFEKAIMLGATYIRVGTALFGNRE
jgi:hypothetical protein